MNLFVERRSFAQRRHNIYGIRAKT